MHDIEFLVFLFCGFVNKGLHNGVPRLPPHSGMSPGRQYMPPYHGTPTGMRPMTGGYPNTPPNSMLPGHLAGTPQGGMSPYSLTPHPPGQGGGAVPPNMCYSISPPSLSASGLSALQEMLRRPFNSPSPGATVSVTTAEFYPTVETGRVLAQPIRKVKTERNCPVEIVYVKSDLINHCFIDFKFKMKVKKECEITGFRILWN